MKPDVGTRCASAEGVSALTRALIIARSWVLVSATRWSEAMLDSAQVGPALDGAAGGVCCSVLCAVLPAKLRLISSLNILVALANSSISSLSNSRVGHFALC